MTDPFDGFSLFFLEDNWTRVDVVQLLDDIQTKEARPDITPCQLLADSLRTIGDDIQHWEELAEQWGGHLRSEDGIIVLAIPENFAEQVDIRLWRRVK